MLIVPQAGSGFRATSGDPLPASAEGATREEALDRLRSELEGRVRGGAEVVTLRVAGGRVLPSAPVWPADDLTAAWLAGIAEARAAANAKPDPWDPADRP